MTTPSVDAAPAVAGESSRLATARQVLRSFTPYALVSPPVAVMALLIVYPALTSIVDTLTVETEAGRAFTLEQYRTFFSLPDAWTNLWFTLRITGLTVAILFLVCFPISYYVRFSRSWLVGPVQALALFPLFVPGIIAAFSLVRFLADNGWLDSILVRTLGWEGYRSPINRPMGIIIGLVWEGMPVTIIVLAAGLAQIPNSLIESARDVGANRLQLFARIIIPLLARPILIVLTLNFLSVFGAFTIPLLMGGASPQMYGHYMQNRLYNTGLYTMAQVAAVVMFLVSAAVGALYVRAIVNQRTEEQGGL